MASDVDVRTGWSRSPVRILMWSLAGFLLLLPAVAMQFVTELRWGPLDFGIVAVVLAAACGVVELGARASGNRAYRAGVGLAVLTAFLLIWPLLAVGVVGHEGNPANLMFVAVLAIAAIGAILARGRPAGLVSAMGAAALAQLAAHLVAYVADLGGEEPNRGLVLLIGLGYTGLWLLSAACFRAAARAGR